MTCQASRVATALNKDRTEHPTDVVWSDDGLIVYTVNEDDRGDMNGRQLSMNKVAVPFLVTSDLMTSQGEDVTCDAIDGDNVAGLAGGPMHTEQENILIQDDGKIFFILKYSLISNQIQQMYLKYFEYLFQLLNNLYAEMQKY